MATSSDHSGREDSTTVRLKSMISIAFAAAVAPKMPTVVIWSGPKGDGKVVKDTLGLGLFRWRVGNLVGLASAQKGKD
ncbi:hypothetical protein BDP81DRAFT_401352 [Colletotrichum phormii]|uniref:Uncharacterized protein n=1 Tax=Colletotrichum phormii TaxID=359342 RepID=A0AAJ0A566_9PEZI|nr:uncharacterized protein BDP81DRAFT_401352 [Colletotrichum phormii]KAK1655222.1 hypothetical protein BDP81DRAFT_401352 [Colletotrichum phormii]